LEIQNIAQLDTELKSFDLLTLEGVQKQMKQYEDQLRTIVANTTSQEKADNPEKATTQEITNSLDLGASGGNSLPLDQSQTNI